MSETVKLIIEIPEETYREVKEGILLRNFAVMSVAIQNGIPLDDVKAEIEQKAWDTQEVDGEHDNYKVVEVSDVFEILDNIGKGDKEKC